VGYGHVTTVMTADGIEGGCLCGAVRYRAGGTPYNLTHCHCTICRRASAAAFVPWATFRARDFTFTAGTPGRFASSARAVRTFCSRCGSPLTFQLDETPEEIDVTICSLDHPERVAPVDHTWTHSQLPWIKLADGLPCYAENRIERP
jgi:hypothetical protein